jgi:hypothetical protein
MPTRQRKLELLRSVDDEDYLRKEVLIPIYNNMGQFEDVIDHHGATERGTDIVLIRRTPFGDPTYTSVIVKSKSINFATSGTNTASNLMQQITMAINSGYDCAIQRRNVRFNEIVIVTNKAISNQAREVLNKHADSQNYQVLHFQTDAELVDLIDKHLPDFYFYVSSQHSRLAAALKRKCDKLNELQNIPGMNVEVRNLIDVFVQPKLKHTSSQLVEGQTKTKSIIKTPRTILSGHSRILIMGRSRIWKVNDSA